MVGLTAFKRSGLTNLPYTFTVHKARNASRGVRGYIAIGRSEGGQLLYAQGWSARLPKCFRNVAAFGPAR